MEKAHNLLLLTTSQLILSEEEEKCFFFLSGWRDFLLTSDQKTLNTFNRQHKHKCCLKLIGKRRSKHITHVTWSEFHVSDPAEKENVSKSFIIWQEEVLTQHKVMFFICFKKKKKILPGSKRSKSFKLWNREQNVRKKTWRKKSQRKKCIMLNNH